MLKYDMFGHKKTATKMAAEYVDMYVLKVVIPLRAVRGRVRVH